MLPKTLVAEMWLAENVAIAGATVRSAVVRVREGCSAGSGSGASVRLSRQRNREVERGLGLRDGLVESERGLLPPVAEIHPCPSGATISIPASPPRL